MQNNFTTRDSAYAQIILNQPYSFPSFPNFLRSASVPPLLSVNYFIYLCLISLITVEFEEFFGNFVYMFLIQYMIQNYFLPGNDSSFHFLNSIFFRAKVFILINLILTDNLILIKSNLFFYSWNMLQAWQLKTHHQVQHFSYVSSRYVRIVLYRNRELTTLSSYSLFLIIFIFLKYAFP